MNIEECDLVVRELQIAQNGVAQSGFAFIRLIPDLTAIDDFIRHSQDEKFVAIVSLSGTFAEIASRSI